MEAGCSPTTAAIRETDIADGLEEVIDGLADTSGERVLAAKSSHVLPLHLFERRPGLR